MAFETIILNKGLNSDNNKVNLEQGSLEDVSNLDISSDGTLTPRRGFKEYSDSFNNPIDSVFEYNDRILVGSENKLFYDDGSGKFSPLKGEYKTPDTNTRIRSVNQNKNCYFTTKEGIFKISLKDENSFSEETECIKAGGLKSSNITGKFIIRQGEQNSFFLRDSAVAYRVLWGERDENNNLILGVPSEKFVVYNECETLIKSDLNTVLSKINLLHAASGVFINDNNYDDFILNDSSNIEDLYTNLVQLAEKLDNEIKITSSSPIVSISSASLALDIITINTTSGINNVFSVGDLIELKGMVATSGNPNGIHQILSVTSTTLTFKAPAGVSGTLTTTAAEIYSYNYRNINKPSLPSAIPTNSELISLHTYLENIIIRLKKELSLVINPTLKTRYITPLKITKSGNVELKIVIPKDYKNTNFFQIYRTPLITASGAVSISDLIPGDDFNLIYENYPTDLELNEGVIYFTDTIPELFRANGNFLYTNANSGEGISQANDLPPYAKDVALYKGYTFYANTKTRQRVIFNLIGTSLLSSTSKILIGNGKNNNIYEFIEGVAQEDVLKINASISGVAGKHLLLNSGDNFKKYYIWFRVDGVGTDPNLPDRIGLRVDLESSIHTTLASITKAIRAALSYKIDEFDITHDVTLGEIKFKRIDIGETTPLTNVDVPLTLINSITTPVTGVGTSLKRQKTTITTVPATSITPGSYFLINSAQDFNLYYVWFKKSGVGSDPSITNRIGIQVDIGNTDSASTVANKLKEKLDLYNDFINTVSGSTVTVENKGFGSTTNASDVSTTFTITTVVAGKSKVALFSTPSPSRNIDLTAKELVSAINMNKTDAFKAYYLSTQSQLPGNILIESKNLNDDVYYVLANDSDSGKSFNPDLSPEQNITITSITSGVNTTITFSTNHEFLTGDKIIIIDSTTTPKINGVHVVKKINATQIEIPINTTSGGLAKYIKDTNAVFSDDEKKENRIYFSKYQIPEAVPISNYIDIGDNSPISRIMSFRDALYIFKADGVYRLSGESLPFVVNLFDGSLKLISEESLGKTNNFLFFLANVGIVALSESSLQIISSPINNKILKSKDKDLGKFNWGLGYEDDNSYLFFTFKNEFSTFSDVCYKYSIKNGTWTKYDVSFSCGIVKKNENLLYLAYSNENKLAVERKKFDRTDYSDKELKKIIGASKYNHNEASIKFSTISGIEPGDVVLQVQPVSVYRFNQLLKKLDIDAGLNDNDYFNTLKAEPGNNLRAKLISLVQKLDLDTGAAYSSYESDIAHKTGFISSVISDVEPVITTSAPHGLFTGRIIQISNSTGVYPSLDGVYKVTVLSSTTFKIKKPVKDVTTIPPSTITFETLNEDFEDLKSCYNKTISNLNADVGIAFNNYEPSTYDTNLETVITKVNNGLNKIFLNSKLDFIEGEILIFKHFKKMLIVNPMFFGDVLTLKHFREVNLSLENKSITEVGIYFKSDLFPEFNGIKIQADGFTLFGLNNFGSGFFGGNSNQTPIRTLVPLQYQRCRFLQVKITHDVARENFKLNSLAIVGNIQLSERVYRK